MKSKRRTRSIIPFNKKGQPKLVDEDLINKANHTNECALCKSDYGQWGNNGLPVVDGLVCDECNQTKVIPARMDELFKVNDNEPEEVTESYYEVLWYEGPNRREAMMGDFLSESFETEEEALAKHEELKTKENVYSIWVTARDEEDELIRDIVLHADGKVNDAKGKPNDNQEIKDLKDDIKEVEKEITKALNDADQEAYDKASNEKNKLVRKLIKLQTKKTKLSDEDTITLTAEELEILQKALPKLITLLAGEAELELEEEQIEEEDDFDEVEDLVGNEDFDELENQMNEDLEGEEDKLEDQDSLGKIIADPQKKEALKKVLADAKGEKRRLVRKKQQDADPINKPSFTSRYDIKENDRKLQDSFDNKAESAAMSARFGK